jgi:hypothetical protein
VCARFRSTHGPGERLRRRQSEEYGKTYPPSILLGPWRFARTSHSLSHLFFSYLFLSATNGPSRVDPRSCPRSGLACHSRGRPGREHDSRHVWYRRESTATVLKFVQVWVERLRSSTKAAAALGEITERVEFSREAVRRAVRACCLHPSSNPKACPQQRLVKTGGRLVKHARYYRLLLAECHLTRRLFGGMLQRIARLPSPAG